MNFSINIIKNKSIKHILKESLKTDFVAYCFVIIFTLFIVLGTLLKLTLPSIN